MKTTSKMDTDGYTRSGCGCAKIGGKPSEFKIFKTFFHRELKSSNMVVEDRAH